MNNLKLTLLVLVSSMISSMVKSQQVDNLIKNHDIVFEEANGMVAAEAEHFYKQTKTEIRRWYRVSKNEWPQVGRDEDSPHCKDAGNNVYLEILPDTRVTHSDKLIAGENFSNAVGEMAVLHYKVKINSPGRYYVWVRAFSTGSEDNGMHAGIDGQWPESGQRLQWYEGKNTWRWESKQRTEEVHCGEPYKIYFDIEEPGIHEVMFSMREDGFEWDRFLMTTNKEYVPEGIGPSVKLTAGKLSELYPTVLKDGIIETFDNKDFKVPEISGELKKWHKITLTFDGPETSETNENNPFVNYRLNVQFTHGKTRKSYLVPGYFAADGNAAETSADSGNKWCVHFSPDETGEWGYKVQFREGNWVAVSERHLPGESAGYMDGLSGTFSVTDTDKDGYDNDDGGEKNWVKFIKDRPKDKPFFFLLAAYDAHRPWGADTFKITHDPAKMILPPYFADTPETRQDMASYYNEIGRFDYYVGKVREELEKQDVLDNTVIIVMADNGRPFPRCKTRVYHSGMKTPFIVFWPKGIRRKGIKTESLISAIDIAPTILKLAGIKAPDEYQGTSFVHVFKNPAADIRTSVFSEHNWHDYEAHERMIRTKDYLYVLNARPNLTNGGPADSKSSATQQALNQVRDDGKLTQAQSDIFMAPRPTEELFDVKNDPQQFLNLASMPQFQEKLKEMRGLLKNWQYNTGDTTPEHLTPDWHNRETDKALKTCQFNQIIDSINV